MNQDFQVEYCFLDEIKGRQVVRVSFSRSQALFFADMLLKAAENPGSIKLTFNLTDKKKLRPVTGDRVVN